jgi:single-strand DNA-binding protein
MLKLQIIGNLGADAVVKHDPNAQKDVLRFNVAHSERYQDKATGQQQERTTWVTCFMRVAPGGKLAQYLVKGKKVYAEGTPRSGHYTNEQTGELVDTLALNVMPDGLELLSSGGDGQQQGYQQAPAQQQRPAPQAQAPAQGSGDPFGDDVPF